jgi:hypothetical protein
LIKREALIEKLDIKSESTATGRLYFKGANFFASHKIRKMLEDLRQSSIYTEIKSNTEKK